MTVIMHSKTRLYEKGGFTFYNVTNCRVDFKIDGLKSYFSNLFNGNKQLGECCSYTKIYLIFSFFLLKIFLYIFFVLSKLHSLKIWKVWA